MELIVYEGAELNEGRIRDLARKAGAESLAGDLELTVCRTEEELSAALRRSFRQEGERLERHIPFRTDQGLRFLKLSQVCWLRGADHRLTAVLTDGTELRSRTRRTSTREMVAPLMEEGRFFRTSRAIFVNLDHVAAVTAEGVRMDNGETVPISRKCYSEWLSGSRKGGL